jgi:hypothetical protein
MCHTIIDRRLLIAPNYHIPQILENNGVSGIAASTERFAV